MKLNYTTEGLGNHLTMFGIFIVLTVIGWFVSLIFWPLFIIWFAVALCAVIYPCEAFWTLDGDNIEELKSYNSKIEDKKEHIKIPHPQRTLIVICTIVGFFTFGVGHFIAILVGSKDGYVEISEKHRKLLGLSDDGSSKDTDKKSLSVMGVDIATISNAKIEPPRLDQKRPEASVLDGNMKNLRELKSLLDDGLIDQETFDKKKKEIGF